jgi:hypothetical protein
MIINAEHIQLNGGSGAPDALADAELYVDEEAGLLYVSTENGIYGVPLSVIAPPDAPGDATLALVKTDTGAEFSAMAAGAGGRPFDSQPWRIPGRSPILAGVSDFSPGINYYGLFEMSEAKTVTRQRVVLIGTANVTFGICEWSGTGAGTVLTSTSATTVGPNISDVSVTLSPGVYATFFSTDAPVQARVLHCGAYLGRNTPDFPGHPVALSF